MDEEELARLENPKVHQEKSVSNFQTMERSVANLATRAKCLPLLKKFLVADVSLFSVQTAKPEWHVFLERCDVDNGFEKVI